MYLQGMIDRERTLREPHGVCRVHHRPGASPPCSFDYGDEPVVRMIVRVAEAVGLELVDVDVQPGLGRIAVKDGLVGGDLVGRVAPVELLGRLGDDGRGVELDGAAGGHKAQGGNGDGELKTQQGEAIRHIHLLARMKSTHRRVGKAKRAHRDGIRVGTLRLPTQHVIPGAPRPGPVKAGSTRSPS
jgi:hypothetical protein